MKDNGAKRRRAKISSPIFEIMQKMGEIIILSAFSDTIYYFSVFYLLVSGTMYLLVKKYEMHIKYIQEVIDRPSMMQLPVVGEKIGRCKTPNQQKCWGKWNRRAGRGLGFEIGSKHVTSEFGGKKGNLRGEKLVGVKSMPTKMEYEGTRDWKYRKTPIHCKIESFEIGIKPTTSEFEKIIRSEGRKTAAWDNGKGNDRKRGPSGGKFS